MGARGHVPVRMCVVCRRRRPKHELLRIVVTPEGFVLDESGKKPGRGAYVCPDRPECWDEKKLRRFARNQARALSEMLRMRLGGGSRAENADIPARP